MYLGLNVKCLLFLSDFNKTCICLQSLAKLPQHKIAQKFFTVEASCCIRTDGQINFIKIIVTFATFWKSIKIYMRPLSSFIPSISKQKKSSCFQSQYWPHAILNMAVVKGLKVFTIRVPNVCFYRAWKECCHFTGIRG